MGLTTNPAGLLSQPPIQGAANQSAEVSRNNPAQGERIQRLENLGLNAKMRENLMQIARELTTQWSEQIILKQRETAKALEYSKGNQFVVLDPYTNQYYNPFQAGIASTFNSDSLANLYQISHNHIQFLDGVYVSVLSASIPKVQFWPSDAESDLDNRKAQASSRGIRMIGRQNKESELLEQQLRAFFYGGSYWRHTRWSMDERICKPTYIDKEEMQPQEVLPDRYECPDCGASTPAQQGMQATCQQCGRPMTSADFHAAVKINMPVVTGRQEVPQGQVRMSIYNCMSIIQLPQTPSEGNPIMNTPMLRLSAEIFPGALRGMYPDAWDLAKGGTSDSNRDGEQSRMLRLRTASPSWSRGQVAGNQLPTYYRDWFQPDAYDFLDKKEDADMLHKQFPKGLCIASLGNEILDARQAEMHKEWSWAGTRTDVGAYPPSRVHPAMPIQDEINDNENTIREYCDRAACGPILYNKKLVGEQLNNQHMKPGTMKGITINAGGSDPAFKLEQVFYQFKAQLDPAIFKHQEGLTLAIQILSRITPQSWGGAQQGIETKGGQEQALKTNMGVMWGDWNQIRLECAWAANIAIACLKFNATTDMKDVVDGDDSPGFKNENIPVADLTNGEAEAFPEADQGYPIGYEQQRDLYRELLGMADGKVPNPLVMEMLNNYKNRRLVLRYVGDSDMVLPEEAARNKCLTDITKLVEPNAEPIPSVDPTSGQPIELPSIMPDADFFKDFWDVVIGAAVDYGLNNAKLMDTNPKQFENLRLYLKQARYMQKVGQAQDTLPPGGVPQLGPGDAAGAPGAPGGGAPSGTVAPTPMPPAPVGPAPMSVH